MEEACKNYNAIFWKPFSLDLLKSGGFWLSSTPEQWSGGWGSASVRAATWAHFRVRETNRAFCHINVHLDSVSEEVRQQGCLLILEQLAALHLDHLPLVLTGDFNVPADVPDAQLLSIDPTITNACYRLLLDQGFVDTYHAAGKQETETALTYHAFEGERFLPACRCDWILTRNETCSFTVHSCEILRDAAPPIYPSDHYPVLTELVMHYLTMARLVEVRFEHRLHRWGILGCPAIREPGHPHEPKGDERLTEGELLHGIRGVLSHLGRAGLVFMRGVDEHEACPLLWVGRGVQAHEQPPIGVPHQDIGTNDAGPGQQRMQFGDHVKSRTRQGTRIAPAIACAVIRTHAREGGYAWLDLAPHQ